MIKFVITFCLILIASTARADDPGLDWSTPEALNASAASLSPQDRNILDRAGLVIVIKRTTKETRLVPGLMAIGKAPKTDYFPLMKEELEGKSMDEIRAIAFSMN